MELRALGPDAASVSAIGFGGMPLSIEGRPDESQAIRVLHSVLDAGVTLLDTADSYSLDGSDTGHNERLIATALRSWPGSRDGIVVATKGGTTRPDRRRWKPNGRPEHLRAACERSLEALGVERIDLYQLHSVDPEVPFKESVGAIAELQAEGKVRWVGVSNVSYHHLLIARRIVPVQTVQNPLNPFFQSARHRRLILPSLVSFCAKRGIGFLAYSPLGGSGLSRKLADHSVLRAIAERRGASAHAVVLAWLLAQGPNVIPIPAARSVEHALDSVGAARLELSDDEIRAIDRAEFLTE